VACARRPEGAAELTALAQESAGRVTVHALDVTDHAAIEALAKQLAGTPIDVLLNVAGVLVTQGFGKSDYAGWTAAFRINTLAPMKMSEAFVDHVAASGQKKIVTLSSTLGSIGANSSGSMYNYRSTKAAVNAVMKSLSIDLGRRGIIAVPLHPGWVRTDMGGARADIDVKTSVSGMRRVIAGLSAAQSGKFMNYKGEEQPW
jgi:NAD(P)-dependent dehydrogenase (short-subunit alcohol dehydrogenase family)